MDKEFNRLMGVCHELGTMFDQGLVFIGGIAVYLHAINSEREKGMAEATHDGDFYISLSDMADLRDMEEVTPNRRLSKSQIIKNGFEFDIYTERLSSLIVPFDEVIAHSVFYDAVRVASLEHLFVLKLEAYADRKDSAKGGKDARDLIRLSCLAQSIGFDERLCCPFVRDDHLDLFERLKKSPEVVSLAEGNSVKAKQYRQEVCRMLDRIEAGCVDGVCTLDKVVPPAP